MSRSIDLFIDFRQPIDELCPELERLTGMTFTPGPDPGTWLLEEGGVHAVLHRHQFSDDRDLLMERFPYALSARVASGTRLADATETTLLRLVSETLHGAGLPTLLVHDLQYRDRPEEGDGASPGASPSAPEVAAP